jgi:hypothetical protein
MQETKPAPTRRTTGLLFAAFLALGLGLVACGGNDPALPPPSPPTLSSEAGVLSISLSKGSISPAYNSEVRNYGVSLPIAADSLDVTATLVDTKAALRINNEEARSGVAHQVKLAGRQTVISIATVAEDRVGKDLVRLVVDVAEPNTRIWVLDSVGGTYPKGTKLTLADASGRVLESNIDFPADRNGQLAFNLDLKGRYNIYAQGAETAQACFAGFDRSREDTATLYCLPKWASVFPAEAPKITDIWFSDQANDNWERLPDGANSLSAPMSKLQYVKVSAKSRSAITEADWGPLPISIMLDSPAWLNSAAQGIALENSVPAPEGGQMYYQSTYRFRTPGLSNSVSSQERWLDIVAYDIANNRVERRVYLTVEDSAASVASDPNLTQFAPRATLAQAQTYGISEDYPAIGAVDAYGAFYFTYLTFQATDDVFQRQMTGYWDEYEGIDPLDMIDMTGVSLPGIRGFEVWRSDGDDRNFKKIDTVRYAQPNAGFQVSVNTNDYWPPMVTISQAFTYRDTSPDVVEDTMYYKFRAFNGNPADGGYGPMSDAVAVRPLPPFTTQLVSPVNDAVLDTVWPTFRFKVTNVELLKNGMADEFNFSFILKHSHYNSGLANQMRYLVDFKDLDATGRPRCYYIRDDGFSVLKAPATVDGTLTGAPYLWFEADGTFVLDTDNAEYRRRMPAFADPMVPGFAYEWSIFGLRGGVGMTIPTNSAHFKTTYAAPAGKRSEAYSFGSATLYGFGSPNGFFRFAINTDTE